MSFADLALARRLEAAEVRGRTDVARAHARLFPAGGAAIEPIADGVAVFNPVSANSTHAFGLGMTGPVSVPELEQLEAFYRRRGLPPSVELCPLASPTLADILASRGYREINRTSVLVRPLPGDGIEEPAPPLVVRQARADEVDLWAALVARGFSGREDVTPAERELGALPFHLPATVCFLCLIDDEPAGGAALALRDGVATLVAASTLPAFRGRGAQTALLRARLAFAAAAGHDLAMTCTTPGSISQRNAERVGFRSAYQRILLEQPSE